jgi:hypothetical protein
VTHAHAHADGHDHARPHEDYTARSHPEFVVLDIGGDVGALIVHAPANLLGTEIEISPAGEDDRRSHKDVLERRMGDRPAYTAVFDGLREGAYTLWSRDVPRARDVRITGGAIAEVDWRA